MTTLSNIITPSNVLTTTNTATVTNKTLTAPTVTGMVVSDGTANGVTYLNGSKVLTSGSALTFDGTNLGVGVATATAPVTVKTSSGYLSQDIVGDATNGWSSLRFRNAANSATNVFFNYDNGAYKFGTVANEPVVFNVSNAEQMRLTSTGLGIGTSSPKEKLDSRGAAVFSGDNATGTNAFGTAEGVLLSTASGVARITAVSNGNNNVNLVFRSLNGGSASSTLMLDYSGNLGLGVTPSAWAGSGKIVEIGAAGNAIWGQSTADIYFTSNAYYNAGWKYGGTNAAAAYEMYAGAHKWFSAGSGTAGNAISFTQAMTLDASGNWLLGTTSSNFQTGERVSITPGSGKNAMGIALTNTDTLGIAIYSPYTATAAVSAMKFQAHTAAIVGSITFTSTATTYNTTSDYRLKTVTGAVTGQGSRIDALKPIDYLWTEGGQQARGFLAHEFQTVYPNSVTGDKDALDANGNPKYQSMQAATSEVIADLVAEIQSLRQRLSAANL